MPRLFHHVSGSLQELFFSSIYTGLLLAVYLSHMLPATYASSGTSSEKKWRNGANTCCNIAHALGKTAAPVMTNNDTTLNKIIPRNFCRRKPLQQA